MKLGVKLLVGVLLFQSITISHSRWADTDWDRTIRSADNNEAATPVEETMDEINKPEIEVFNSPVEVDPNGTNNENNNVDRDSDSHSDSDESKARPRPPCYGKNCPGGGGGGGGGGPCYGKNCPSSESDSSSSSEEWKPCKGKGCNGGGGPKPPAPPPPPPPPKPDSGSSSSEEVPPCKGKGCGGGGTPGYSSSQSSESEEVSANSSEEEPKPCKGNCNGGGGGVIWPGLKCSIFPRLTLCVKREFTRMYDEVSMDIMNNRQVSTPLDSGFEMIESIAENYPTPEAQMLRTILPATRVGLRGFFSLFRGLRHMFIRSIKFLESIGIVPASLVDVLETLFPALASSSRSYNPLLRGWNSKPPATDVCPISDFTNFFKITALRAYIKHGLRTWVWLGLPVAEAERIRDLLLKFLKDEYGNEFDCPLNLKPYKGFLASCFRGVFKTKLAHLFEKLTEALLNWTQCDSTSFDTILGIIRDFVSSLKDKYEIKWGKILYSLEIMFDKFKDFIGKLLDKCFGKFPIEKPPATTAAPTTTEEPPAPPPCDDSLLGTGITDWIDKLNPADFANILGTLVCQIFQSAPYSMNIAESLSFVNLLQDIRPIAGITSPSGLVTTLSKNIPGILAKLCGLFESLREKILFIYSKLSCTALKEAGVTMANYTASLEEALLGKPLSCLTELKPLINELNAYANTRLVTCVEEAIGANRELVMSMREGVMEFRNEILEYYESLENATPETVTSLIAAGNAIVARFKEFVNDAIHLDISKIKLDSCVARVQKKVASKGAKLRKQIEACE